MTKSPAGSGHLGSLNAHVDSTCAHAMSTCSRFKGKVAIVTGGGRGLGAAICKRLGSEGARVVVADIDKEAADRTSQEIDSSIALEADVTDEKQVERLVAEAIKWGGKLDIYVNNAGDSAPGSVTQVTGSDWDATLALHLKAYAYGIKHMALAVSQAEEKAVKVATTSEKTEAMAPQYAIVNMSSTVGVRGMPDIVRYATAKAGILGMTRSCAFDLGKQNIRVNAVVPSTIDTESVRAFMVARGQDDEAVTKWQDRHIIKRLGRPEEVAAAVAFLASDDASFMTGTSLDVDGGYLAL